MNNRWIYFLSLSIAVFFVGIRIETNLSWINESVTVFLLIPVIEELLKFFLYRATGLPLAVGLIWGLYETLGYGIMSLDRLVNVPHFLFAVPYVRYGWKGLPIAIGMHMAWNSYIGMNSPEDKVFLLATILFSFLCLVWLRNDTRKPKPVG